MVAEEERHLYDLSYLKARNVRGVKVMARVRSTTTTTMMILVLLL